MHLVISIVVYQPQEAVLLRALKTLAHAFENANHAGRIDQGRLVLTDHSPQRVNSGSLAHWRTASWPISVEYTHNPSNPGFGAGHNAAFHQYADKADFFLVANPDVLFGQDSLDMGLAFLAEHPATGVIAPALIEAEGLRPACFRAPDVWTLLLRSMGWTARESARIARYECRDWEASQPVFNPPLMSGCCLLFRGEAYARLGGFDPGYFLYFEDFDLSRRATRLGISAYCPTMRVHHLGGGAAKKGWQHWRWFFRSAWRYGWST